MQFNKYSKDFTVEYEKTPDGRRKARAVYKGGYYDFVDTASGVRRTAAYFTALCAAAWCAVLVPLLFLSAAARTFYVLVPHVCALFPLAGLTGATFGLWTEKPPLTQEKSDRISLRAPRSALVMTVLSGIAAAGLLLRLVLDQAPALWPGDLIFGACEAVLLAASCLLLRAGKRTATRVWEAE